MLIVLLDLMDTVLVDPYNSAVLKLCPSGTTVDDFQNARSMDSFIQFESGIIHESTFLRQYYKKEFPWKENHYPGVLKIKKELFRNIRYMEGMHSLLISMQSSDMIQSGIASNYSPWYREIFRLKPELDDFFDFVFFSCELGIRKPDPAYYQKIYSALRKIHPDLQPQEILFVDDRLENLAPAENLKWNTHHFQNSNLLKKTLQDFDMEF